MVPYPDLQGIGRIGLVLDLLRTLELMLVHEAEVPVLGRAGLLMRLTLIALVDVAVAGNLRSAIIKWVTTSLQADPGIIEALKARHRGDAAPDGSFKLTEADKALVQDGRSIWVSEAARQFARALAGGTVDYLS